MKTMKCEACGEKCHSKLIVSKDEIYILDLNCLTDLINLNLSPEHFFNLLENGHTINEFYLHEDFYDSNTGEALQPK